MFKGFLKFDLIKIENLDILTSSKIKKLRFLATKNYLLI